MPSGSKISADALIILDLEDGKVVSCNEEAKELLGSEDSPDQSRSIKGVEVAAIMRGLRGQRCISLPKICVHDNAGKERALELRASSLDVGGRQLGFCSFKDVSALDEAELQVERLKRLSQRCASFLVERDEDTLLQQIVAAALELFPSADGAALILSQNNGHMKVGHLAGYPSAQLALRAELPIFDGFPLPLLEPDTAGMIYNSAEHDSPSSSTKRDSELVEMIKSVCGGRLPQCTMAVPVGVPTERVGVLILDAINKSSAFSERDLNLATIMGSHAGGALCYARNLKMAQERQEEIVSASQKRIEFVAGLVHEVRTPLTVFRGFLDLLMEENLSNDGRRYVELMTKDATRLGRTMNDLLQLARIEAGAPTSEVKYERPDEVVQRVLEEFKIPCRDKDLALKANLKAMNVKTFIDEPRLTQILRNLLENALKFTEPGGEICVMGNVKEEFIFISVRDTGRGIDAEDLPFLTNSFYQVRKTGAESKDGVGLGLAIVKRLLDSLGGELFVESTPGVGSCFKFSYPTVNEGG